MKAKERDNIRARQRAYTNGGQGEARAECGDGVKAGRNEVPLGRGVVREKAEGKFKHARRMKERSKEKYTPSSP